MPILLFFLYLSYELQNNKLEEGERKFICFDNNPLHASKNIFKSQEY